MDKKELLELVKTKLKEKFHGSIETAELLYDYPVFVINKNKIHEVLTF